MKIWVDLRFLKQDNLYSLFILEVVKELVKNQKHNVIVYSNDNLELNSDNCKIELVKEKVWSIGENLILNSKFKKEKFDLMIFFNEYKPITYKEDYIMVIPSLQRLFFGPFKNSFSKYHYLRLLNSNLKNAKKIICFDKQTLWDLNERFNIKEDKIEIIKWFFPLKKENIEEEINKIDIKSRYNLKSDYIIYDSMESSIKNLDKVLLAIKKMREQWSLLNLLILWDDAWKNLEFRKLVLDYEISDLVFFVWEIDEKSKYNYYKQSIGLVFPNIYATFPFELNNALIFDTPIISNDLESIKESTLGELEHFNSLSNTDTLNALTSFLKKKKSINYNKILSDNSVEFYVKNLQEMIDNRLF